MFGHHYFGSHYFGTHYFGPGAAVPPPTPPATATGQSNAGGGKHRAYLSPSPAFWAAREKFLAEDEPANVDAPPAEALPAPKLPVPTAQNNPQLAKLISAQRLAEARIAKATTEAEVIAATERYQKLTLDITQFFDDYYNRAATLLLHDLF